MKTTSILFITWDSERSNYLESLFFPILNGLQSKGYKCHVMQFSWANRSEVQRIAALANQLEIPYTQIPIHRKPHAGIGAIWTVYKGVAKIKEYIQKHKIQILMPRSIMPAMMINRLGSWLQRQGVSIIYDADGLSIEERVDFSGLKPGSFRYLQQKKEEKKILHLATKVLTRSQKAIKYLQENHGLKTIDKFYVVSNGRDVDFFKRNADQRKCWRKQWGLREEDMLLAYTGSLGAPYAWERMLEYFSWLRQVSPQAQFLVLTREDPQTLVIPKQLQASIRMVHGAFGTIPSYLSAADLGISLRTQALSLLGLAPIKIGEYLLMGLPLILSPGLGDSQQHLEQHSFVWMDQPNHQEAFKNWIQQIKHMNASDIREVGMQHYSLDSSIASYVRALQV